MHKCIILLFIFVLFTAKANCQVTNGNWLVGGSGKFLVEEDKTDVVNGKTTQLDLSPDIGYFFLNKFAAGARIFFEYGVQKKIGAYKNTYSNIGAGPFLRYYFLPVDNRINLLVQSAYQHSLTKSSGNTTNINDLLFSAGPVLYFNSSVGLELTANYELYDFQTAYTTAKKFYITMGLQIHLESDRNE